MTRAETSEAVARYRVRRLNAWAPPERLCLWEWAEKAITLSERTSPFPGRYRVAVAPYVRGPMEALGDSAVTTVILVFAAQSGKTQNLIICPAAYWIAQDPGPALLVLPNETMARSFSESRLQPAFDDCAEICALKPSDPDRYKLLEMHFQRMTLNLIGSNSAANLAQRPVRFLMADEIDKFPPASEREADALSLALVRTRSYWNHKIVLTSTPTIPDGNIWRRWGRCGQRHYLVPCPHCGHYQKLIFGLEQEYELFSDVVKRPAGKAEERFRLRWPKGMAISDLDDEGWYECEKCRGKIFDRHKRAMLEKGRWDGQGAQHGAVGFHLSALYVPWVRFGEIAAEFLRSKKYPDLLQHVFNSTLALPWDAVAQGMDTIRIDSIIEHASRGKDRTKGYRLNQCPEDVLFLTAGFDVQAHEIWYVVRGWGVDDRSWLISFGRSAVETDDLPAFYAAMQAVLSVDFRKPLILSGIDSGWGERTPEVYALARRFPRLVCVHNRRSNVTKSETGKDVPLPRPRRIDKMPDGKPLPQGPLLYSPSVAHWKRWLFSRVNAASGKWHWPSDLEDSRDGRVYLSHLSSEREVTRKNKRSGRTETVWIVRRAKEGDDESAHEEGYVANHLLDCEVLAAICLEIALTADANKRHTLDEIAHMLKGASGLKSLQPSVVDSGGDVDAPSASAMRAVQRGRRRGGTRFHTL